MGIKYYQEDGVFRYWMDCLDRIALNETGHSVLRYLYEECEAGEVCDDITMTHLAIVMVEYSMTKSLEDKGIRPDLLLGSSLGEYVCMAVSGMVHIKVLMRLLADQSYLLKRKCPQGKMAAVIAEYQPGKYFIGDAEVAAVNYSKHFVISGDRKNVEKTSDSLRRMGIDVFDIPVRYGFHSKSIDCIKNDYAKITKRLLQLPRGKIPVISSFKGAVTDTYTPEDMWGIIRKPIRFNEAIKKFFSKPEGEILIDVGPSSTLAGFSKNILKRQWGIEKKYGSVPVWKSVR